MKLKDLPHAIPPGLPRASVERVVQDHLRVEDERQRPGEEDQDRDQLGGRVEVRLRHDDSAVRACAAHDPFTP